MASDTETHRQVLVEAGVALTDESRELPQLAENVHVRLQESHDATFGALSVGVQHERGPTEDKIRID
jgi:hypothetical protein